MYKNHLLYLFSYNKKIDIILFCMILLKKIEFYFYCKFYYFFSFYQMPQELCVMLSGVASTDTKTKPKIPISYGDDVNPLRDALLKAIL